MDTGAPVARQTRLRLPAAEPQAGALAAAGMGQVRPFTTGQAPALQAAAQRWLQLSNTVDSLHF